MKLDKQTWFLFGMLFGLLIADIIAMIHFGVIVL